MCNRVTLMKASLGGNVATSLKANQSSVDAEDNKRQGTSNLIEYDREQSVHDSSFSETRTK